MIKNKIYSKIQYYDYIYNKDSCKNISMKFFRFGFLPQLQEPGYSLEKKRKEENCME